MDVTASAFLKAYERWNRLSDHPYPTGWIITTATNLSRVRTRRLRRTPEWAVQMHTSAPREPFDPELLAQIDRLTHRQRQVIHCRILMDLSTARTAELLGCAPKTVTVHLHRAISVLRSTIVSER